MQETWMQRAYTPILRWTLRHKAVTLTSAFLLTLASLSLILVIPINLFSAGGDRSLQIEVSLPPGTSPEATLEEVIEIEDRVSGTADVYTSTIGATDAAFGGAPTGLNEASLFVNLSEDAPADIDDRLRSELEKPGRIVRITELDAGPPDDGVQINITGTDYGDISTASQQIIDAISDVEGVANLESNIAQVRPAVSIEVDPDEAALHGLNTRQVGLQLSQYLIGQTVTNVSIDGDIVDVSLSGNPSAVNGVENIQNLMITGPGGEVPLGDVAEVVTEDGPVTIVRTDGVRSATVTGDVVSDDAQAVGDLVSQEIAALDLPPGVSVAIGGVFEDIGEIFVSIFIAMAIGIVLVYLVMVASLGSLRNPIVIVTTLPLALIGALAALAITGRALGLPAMMGLLLLIGIVVTNAIVLISFVEQLRANGMSVYDALISGGRVRLRPILMTALTTSFALLPLAAASGEDGGIISAELATVVIGGLISSTGLTLIVVPIVYTIFNESIPNLFAAIGRRVRRQTA